MSSSKQLVASSQPVATLTGNNKRRKSGQPKSLPPFVKKLWSTVNDQENIDYIHWTEEGESFRVVNREMFEKTVLPKYYKHTNFSSFVRQLNMYGFHKVQDVQHSDEDCWKFESPYFKRDREDLLINIVRNKANDEEEDDDKSKILNELQSVRSSLDRVAKDVVDIRNDNQLLWNEHLQTKNRSLQNNKTLNNLVRFLSAIYGNHRFQQDTIAHSPKTPQRLLGRDLALVNNNFNSSSSPSSPAATGSGGDLFSTSTSASTSTNASTSKNAEGSSNSGASINFNNSRSMSANDSTHISPGLLENVRISDLDLIKDESSPTNSDKSEDSDEQAQRILANTLKSDHLALDLSSQSKALMAIEDLISQQPLTAGDLEDDLDIEDYVSLDPHHVDAQSSSSSSNAVKRQRID